MLVVVAVLLAAVSHIVVDWLWFDALGFGAVFLTIWKAKLTIFGIAASIATGVFAINGLLAVRAFGPRTRRLRLVSNADNTKEFTSFLDLSATRFPWRASILTLAAVLGLFLGFYAAWHWELFLKWRYAVPFGRVDPILGHDLGFYLFLLPVYRIMRTFVFLLLVLASISAVGVYWGCGAIDLTRGMPEVKADQVNV